MVILYLYAQDLCYFMSSVVAAYGISNALYWWYVTSLLFIFSL